MHQMCWDKIIFQIKCKYLLKGFAESAQFLCARQRHLLCRSCINSNFYGFVDVILRKRILSILIFFFGIFDFQVYFEKEFDARKLFLTMEFKAFFWCRHLKRIREGAWNAFWRHVPGQELSPGTEDFSNEIPGHARKLNHWIPLWSID